jgi:hypothetical protein
VFTLAYHASRYEGQWSYGFRVEPNGNRYAPTGELVEEASKDQPETTKPDFKESILARVKPSSVRDSNSLSSLNRKPNHTLSKAIEDIKRKNSSVQ